ncbi:MAG: hypothetical protein MZV70_54405 [Desulfobacterales bacterium]|nr:hypothetical protein [Desulfobacterales bacterium]
MTRRQHLAKPAILEEDGREASCRRHSCRNGSGPVDHGRAGCSRCSMTSTTPEPRPGRSPSAGAETAFTFWHLASSAENEGVSLLDRPARGHRQPTRQGAGSVPCGPGRQSSWPRSDKRSSIWFTAYAQKKKRQARSPWTSTRPTSLRSTPPCRIQPDVPG